MSEMVERLATEFSCKNLEGCEVGGWIKACDERYCRCREFARTAIKTMRDPTEEMRFVVAADWGHRTWRQYQRVIDAALTHSLLSPGFAAVATAAASSLPTQTPVDLEASSVPEFLRREGTAMATLAAEESVVPNLSPSLPAPAATPTDSANPPPVESVGPNSEAQS